MAGAGYKLFNTGDVLTAQQVNEYLQQQTVMVFANSTARTTALSGVLAEGMMSYLQDTNSVEVYNGSAWVSISSDQIPLTTKGDLLTYSTTDTRLPVGTNGQLLSADSTTATGLKWITSSSQLPFILQKNTGEWYGTSFSILTSVARTLTVNTTYYSAMFFDGNIAFDRIGINTASTFAGTAVIRLGLYNASTTTGKPSTVYLDAGTVSCTAASTDYTITISNTPPVGYYWFAFNVQTAAATNTFTGPANDAIVFVNPFVSSTLVAGQNDKAIYTEAVTITSGFATAGTLTSANTRSIPFIRMRAA